MVVKRFIPRENGVVVADIDVEAKRRAGAVIPSIECDDSPDRDTKEESSDEDSPLSELSSPETPPQFQSVADRFRSYRSKPPPTAWRKTSHVVSGRTTKDTPVVNSNKPKIKIDMEKNLHVVSGRVIKDIPIVYTKKPKSKSPSDFDSPLSEISNSPPPPLSTKSDSDTIKKEESSGEESPLSELSSSPETPPEFRTLLERYRSYRPKSSPKAWRRILELNTEFNVQNQRTATLEAEL
ncbi:hypothetical protein KJ359_006339 [Pestalotiopsis sp. 9143b]|nr:hypothetical protein KJ359_006339 [Pestalotiopsis sp. 9143b]